MLAVYTSHKFKVNFSLYQILLISSIYYIIFNMKSEMDLQKAIKSAFGSRIQEVSLPGSYWQAFTPFKISSTNNSTNILLKLIEIPNDWKISEELISKAKLQFQNILHEVDFILVERNLQSAWYLLKAEENIVSVEQYLEIKRNSKQIVEQQVIQNFIQFASSLQSHPLSKQISFDLSQIGITSQRKFLLANYQLYFYSPKNYKPNQLSRNIKSAIFELLKPLENQNDITAFYQHIQSNYSQNIQEAVEKLMGDSGVKLNDLLQTLTFTTEQNLLETTMTDSFGSSGNIPPQEIQNVSMKEVSQLSEGLLSPKIKQPKKKKKTIGLIIIIFAVVLIITAGITIKYLSVKPLVCQDSEYLDRQENKCFSCDISCETCSSSTNLSCLSCQGSQYLVKKDRTQRVGKCSTICSGTKLKSNVCIDSS